MLSPKVIGKRIKSIRESAAMTQKNFCELINCTQAALSGYENGSKIPSIDTLYTISTKCKVSLDWLCGLINNNDNKLSINTNADIITVINELLKNKDIVLDRVERTHTYIDGTSGYPQSYTDNELAVCFNDDMFKTYLDKLKQMQDLLNNNTIDDELYELWLNKTINDLTNEIPSFENSNIKKTQQ